MMAVAHPVALDLAVLLHGAATHSSAGTCASQPSSHPSIVPSNHEQQPPACCSDCALCYSAEWLFSPHIHVDPAARTPPMLPQVLHTGSSAAMVGSCLWISSSSSRRGWPKWTPAAVLACAARSSGSNAPNRQQQQARQGRAGPLCVRTHHVAAAANVTYAAGITQATC